MCAGYVEVMLQALQVQLGTATPSGCFRAHGIIQRVGASEQGIFLQQHNYSHFVSVLFRFHSVRFAHP